MHVSHHHDVLRQLLQLDGRQRPEVGASKGISCLLCKVHAVCMLCFAAVLVPEFAFSLRDGVRS